MAHLHTSDGEIDHTTSAYIVRTDGSEPQIMLHKHKKLGVWLQFGGHIEHDETIWQALDHELLEETGYKLSQMNILQFKELQLGISDAIEHPSPMFVNTHLLPADHTHYHTDFGYILATDQEPDRQVEEHEKTEIGFFTKRDLKFSDDMHENVRKICTKVLDLYDRRAELGMVELPATGFSLEKPGR